MKHPLNAIRSRQWSQSEQSHAATSGGNDYQPAWDLFVVVALTVDRSACRPSATTGGRQNAGTLRYATYSDNGDDDGSGHSEIRYGIDSIDQKLNRRASGTGKERLHD